MSNLLQYAQNSQYVQNYFFHNGNHVKFEMKTASFYAYYLPNFEQWNLN